MVLLFISPSSSGVPATGGARLMARTSVLPNGKNLGAGRIHFARAYKQQRVPMVCQSTSWEAGRDRSVSRHEGFLQPEVIPSNYKQDRFGGPAFFLPSSLRTCFRVSRWRSRCTSAQPSEAVVHWRGGARKRSKEWSKDRSVYSGLCDDEKESLAKNFLQSFASARSDKTSTKKFDKMEPNLFPVHL